MAGMAATPMFESEAVRALGSRTTMLHPEMKRHRAWWRQILMSQVPEQLAELVSSQPSAATAEKLSSSLLVDGERHPHVDLLEKIGAFLSGERGGKVWGPLTALAAAGREADGDLESKEIAAILCGCGGEGGTTRLVWTAVGTADNDQRGPAHAAESLASALPSERVEALGLTVLKETRWDGEPETAGQACEIRYAVETNVGDKCPGLGEGSGRVVLHCCDSVEAETVRLAAQVKRARAWHDRHSACFLPVAWAACAALASKCTRAGGLEASRPQVDDGAGEAANAAASQPSLFSILALLAAFLDKESTGRGVPKDILGVGENPTFGKNNPNLAELFLGFLSFVRQLGAEEKLELLADGEVKTTRPQQASVSTAASLLQGEEGDDTLTGGGSIRLEVDGELCEDLMDAQSASRLRRACRDVERSLTPDRVRGLSVWGQDIRWSLLGYALEGTAATGTKATSMTNREAVLPSYLDWMEVQLLMCMDEQIDAMSGLYGYHLTGRGPPSQETELRLEAQNAADAGLARLAEATYSAALEMESSALVQQEGTSSDWDVVMSGDSSDSLCGGGSGTDDENIDGMPMSPLVAGCKRTATLSPGQTVHYERKDGPDELAAIPQRPSEERGSGVPVGLSELGPLAETAMSESRNADRKESPVPADKSAKIGEVLARGDMVMKAAADAVAAAKTSAANAAASEAAAVGSAFAAEAPKKARDDSATATSTSAVTTDAGLGSGSGGGNAVAEAPRTAEGSGRDHAETEQQDRDRAKAEADERKRSAKERGREHGKQRERKMAAQIESKRKKEKEMKTAEEGRRRMLESEHRARAKKREESLWKTEILREESEENELEFKRRASAMDRARAEQAAARAAQPADGGRSSRSSGSDATDRRRTAARTSKRDSSRYLRSRKSRRSSWSRTVDSRSDSSHSHSSSSSSRRSRSSSYRRRLGSSNNSSSRSSGSNSGSRSLSRSPSSSGSPSRNRNRNRSRSRSRSRSRNSAQPRSDGRTRANRPRDVKRPHSPRGMTGDNHLRRSSRSPYSGGTAGNKTDAREKEVGAQARELPAPAVWSEWRSVSSDAEDNDEAGSVAVARREGTPHRSVSSSVTGGGLRIRVRRGASLERPEDKSGRSQRRADAPEGGKNYASQATAATAHGGSDRSLSTRDTRTPSSSRTKHGLRPKRGDRLRPSRSRTPKRGKARSRSPRWWRRGGSMRSRSSRSRDRRESQRSSGRGRDVRNWTRSRERGRHGAGEDGSRSTHADVETGPSTDRRRSQRLRSRSLKRRPLRSRSRSRARSRSGRQEAAYAGVSRSGGILREPSPARSVDGSALSGGTLSRGDCKNRDRGALVLSQSRGVRGSSQSEERRLRRSRSQQRSRGSRSRSRNGVEMRPLEGQFLLSPPSGRPSGSEAATKLREAGVTGADTAGSGVRTVGTARAVAAAAAADDSVGSGSSSEEGMIKLPRPPQSGKVMTGGARAKTPPNKKKKKKGMAAATATAGTPSKQAPQPKLQPTQKQPRKRKPKPTPNKKHKPTPASPQEKATAGVKGKGKAKGTAGAPAAAEDTAMSVGTGVTPATSGGKAPNSNSDIGGGSRPTAPKGIVEPEGLGQGSAGQGGADGERVPPAPAMAVENKEDRPAPGCGKNHAKNRKRKMKRAMDRATAAAASDTPAPAALAGDGDGNGGVEGEDAGEKKGGVEIVEEKKINPAPSGKPAGGK